MDAKHQTDIQTDIQTDRHSTPTHTYMQSAMPCHAAACLEPCLTYHPQSFQPAGRPSFFVKKKMQTGRSVNTHTHTDDRLIQACKSRKMGISVTPSLTPCLSEWMDGWISSTHCYGAWRKEVPYHGWVRGGRGTPVCGLSVWSSVTYLGGGKRWIDVMHVSRHS